MKEKWQTFMDWCWWTFVIRRNEFHPRLNLDMKKVMNENEDFSKELTRISKLRERAHKLDERWGV